MSALIVATRAGQLEREKPSLVAGLLASHNKHKVPDVVVSQIQQHFVLRSYAQGVLNERGGRVDGLGQLLSLALR